MHGKKQSLEVSKTSGAEGSDWGAIQAPLDKPKHQWAADKGGSPNSLGLRDPMGTPGQDNGGDRSKKFGFKPKDRG